MNKRIHFRSQKKNKSNKINHKKELIKVKQKEMQPSKQIQRGIEKNRTKQPTNQQNIKNEKEIKTTDTPRLLKKSVREFI